MGRITRGQGATIGALAAVSALAVGRLAGRKVHWLVGSAFVGSAALTGYKLTGVKPQTKPTSGPPAAPTEAEKQLLGSIRLRYLHDSDFCNQLIEFFEKSSGKISTGARDQIWAAFIQRPTYTFADYETLCTTLFANGFVPTLEQITAHRYVSVDRCKFVDEEGRTTGIHQIVQFAAKNIGKETSVEWCQKVYPLLTNEQRLVYFGRDDSTKVALLFSAKGSWAFFTSNKIPLEAEILIAVLDHPKRGPELLSRLVSDPGWLDDPRIAQVAEAVFKQGRLLAAFDRNLWTTAWAKGWGPKVSAPYPPLQAAVAFKPQAAAPFAYAAAELATDRDQPRKALLRSMKAFNKKEDCLKRGEARAAFCKGLAQFIGDRACMLLPNISSSLRKEERVKRLEEIGKWIVLGGNQEHFDLTSVEGHSFSSLLALLNTPKLEGTDPLLTEGALTERLRGGRGVEEIALLYLLGNEQVRAQVATTLRSITDDVAALQVGKCRDQINSLLINDSI